MLLEDCRDLTGDNFIFQQFGVPDHEAKATQQWFGEHRPDFIDKHSWPPNSSNLNTVILKTVVHCGLTGTICLMKRSANLFLAFAN